jgi:hypothetical protein
MQTRSSPGSGARRPFEDSIEVDGRKLITLRDASDIAGLPKAEHDAPEW